jgi:sulfur relay (sulfurtransferase) DsrC/TusE family protein
MPHHFAKLYSRKYHVSEKERDMEKRIENKVGAITGMLYSIVTLKVFFPSKSPAKNADQAGGPAPYPIPLEKAGDKE